MINTSNACKNRTDLSEGKDSNHMESKDIQRQQWWWTRQRNDLSLSLSVNWLPSSLSCHHPLQSWCWWCQPYLADHAVDCHCYHHCQGCIGHIRYSLHLRKCIRTPKVQKHLEMFVFWTQRVWECDYVGVFNILRNPARHKQSFLECQISPYHFQLCQHISHQNTNYCRGFYGFVIFGTGNNQSVW